MSTQRTITVYATKGKRKASIDTDVTTWGELKPLVLAEGYDLDSLAATEGINKTDLAHQDAALPQQDFVLFLRPKETKSGIEGTDNMSWKQLRQEVQSAINEYGDEAVEHFNSHESGKNYTQLRTDELRQMVANWNPTEEEEEVEEEEFEENELQEEETYEQPTENMNVTQRELTPAEKVEKAMELLSEVCDTTGDADICERVEDLTEQLEGLLADVENDDSAEARAELERLDQQAQDLMRGF